MLFAILKRISGCGGHPTAGRGWFLQPALFQPIRNFIFRARTSVLVDVQAIQHLRTFCQRFDVGGDVAQPAASVGDEGNDCLAVEVIFRQEGGCRGRNGVKPVRRTQQDGVEGAQVDMLRQRGTVTVTGFPVPLTTDPYSSCKRDSPDSQSSSAPHEPRPAVSACVWQESASVPRSFSPAPSLYISGRSPGRSRRQ